MSQPTPRPTGRPRLRTYSVKRAKRTTPSEDPANLRKAINEGHAHFFSLRGQVAGPEWSRMAVGRVREAEPRDCDTFRRGNLFAG